MMRPVVVLTILSSVLTLLYQLNFQKPPGDKGRSVTSALPSLGVPPPLQFQKPAKSAIANIDVWNLKPVVPLGQMLSLKDMFKPVYILVKNGRVQKLQRSDRPNESWELQGIIMRGTQPRALLYNPGTKKMKNVGAGDVVDEQLTVRSVALGRIILEAKDGKKLQYFELYLFNTQKDAYAIKRKTL